MSQLRINNIDISQITLKITLARAGSEGTKYLTFYKAAKDSIGGSIASMRGDSIGAVTLTHAYDTTKTITFNSSTNAGLFRILRDYFLTGKKILIIYVPTTRGKFSAGFCYDYLQITAATLTFTFEYLQSDGSVATPSVVAGSTARLDITAYNSAYSHKVTWQFGSHSTVQTIAAGTSSATYTIPSTWLDAIPNATSGIATVALETIDTNGNSLGSYVYSFTVTAPSLVTPTMTSVTVTPVNSNATLNSWGVFAYGKTQARITINGAKGTLGSTIKSYSITTSPNIGSATTSSFTTG